MYREQRPRAGLLNWIGSLNNYPPQVAKKPAHALPQRISTHRSSRAHQPDQQTEHHIIAAVHDRLVGPDQHRVIGKPPTKLHQLPQKLLPAHTNTHALPSLPRSTGRTHPANRR